MDLFRVSRMCEPKLMQQVSEKCEWMFDLGDCETGRKVQELIDTEIEEIRSDTVPTEPLVSVWLITYNHRSYIEPLRS